MVGSSNHGLQVKDSNPKNLYKFIIDLISKKKETDDQYIKSYKIINFS